MSPEHLTLYGASSICPNIPLDGEDTTRLYVVSVIFPNGTHGILDNNAQAQIVWNDTLGYVYTRQNGRNVYIYEPIYAANCAYYPYGVSNDCSCNPLPLELSSAALGIDTVTPTESESEACGIDFSGKFIGEWSHNALDCVLCTGFTIICINRQWIYSIPDPQGTAQIDSYAVTNGTCYSPGLPLP
ncbi:hypothetical protein PMAYCL1PPCAC_00262 [Pristionchus mayeri]|uniref:Uncharacterized protein n=1 Tax=Pristionchus mayeri TaxID=1317129 RepID=A0AAN4YW39_9BILA|nr:hypothetical protein PMAYCL1PPCAC_00262 [Pristionchus mayeri]